jgi:endonuclease G, mitochondrial
MSYSSAAVQDFKDLVRASRDERASVRAKVSAGEWTRADPNQERASDFLFRVYQERGREALQGETNDLQPIAFLLKGAIASRAVAKVTVDTNSYHEEGSGFLISPDLFITNQHVVRDAAAARAAKVEFDFQPNQDGKVAATTFRLDPARLELFSAEIGGLDYAVIGLGQRVGGDASLSTLGYCPLSNSPDRHIIGMNVNIIQHPGGQHKQLSVRNNLLTYRTNRTLLYETDTKEGSSGSPVFNDDWDVVALHHYGEPFSERVDENGKPFPIEVNEGIRISAIYADLAARASTLDGAQRDLLTGALALNAEIRRPQLPQLERRPRRPPREALSTSLENVMSSSNDSKDIRITIPAGVGDVTVNFQVGGASRTISRTRPTGGQAPQLRGAAEGKKLDRDYTNRNGFNERFVNGVNVQLSRIVKPRKARVAPLADGNAWGELKYQNFSVLLDQERRFAMLTATNIDGETYLAVDRKTGQASGDEGETWYKDRRISDEHYIGQDFYSNWSHKFDRGHLTRRNDPTWGDSAQEAERANADTFHFTNCTPQHFRFNQSTRFWQGVERYVLEKGVLEPGRARRLTVLQGPVLSEIDDPWAGDLQIPAQFWKVVIWNGPNGLRAVGLVVNQESLLAEDRTFIARPDEEAPVQVAQFHVGLKRIARLAKLDLTDFEQYDTIDRGLPNAGEAMKPIRSMSDIALDPLGR